MPDIKITELYAALLAILIVCLALRIVFLRRRLRIGIGNGGDRTIAKAIRAHGNAVEYIPIALILMLLAELGGTTHWLLQTCGIVLVAARLLHAWGLSRHAGTSFGRATGTAGTWLVILLLAGVNLAHVI